MTIGLFIVFALICFVADLAARTILARAREQRRRREWQTALTESLKLDFSREATSLKRVEIEDPVARILCVDDEDVVLDGFRRILVLDGYAVDTVRTGQEALGLIQSHHYDFVFTDLRMPAMDGVDVVKSVKHMRPDVDVIIITGFATVETAVTCMKFGAMDYVQKPFTEEELRTFVKKAVLRRRDRLERQLKPAVRITHQTDITKVAAGEFSIPGGVLISKGHCWVSLSPEGTAKVGMDDFAKKLIGHVDALELPAVGTTVQSGQPMFAIRQQARRIQFLAPISGRVTKVNQSLKEATAKLDVSPYENQWVGVIEGENLDSELAALKIGKSAESLYQDDIGRARAFVRESAKTRHAGETPEGELCIGVLESLDDDQWNRAAKEFFGRAN